VSATREGRWLVPAGYPGLAWLQSQASAWLEASGVEASTANRVLLALDELAANVVEHASSADGPDPFEVRLSREGVVVVLVVLDAGPAFDPREAAPAPSAATLEEVPVGGLGLTLVRRLAGSIHYERVDGKNHIRLVFPPSGEAAT
jgi:anti-sigma regulatory factor (Ser/Thr protein kinase)